MQVVVRGIAITVTGLVSSGNVRLSATFAPAMNWLVGLIRFVSVVLD